MSDRGVCVIVEARYEMIDSYLGFRLAKDEVRT